MNVQTELIRFLENHSTIARKDRHLTENSLLLEEKILDSLGMLELISFVEETYSIQVPDEDIIPDHFGTIEKLTRYIEDHIDF
jgi:acyl carrier protein